MSTLASSARASIAGASAVALLLIPLFVAPSAQGGAPCGTITVSPATVPRGLEGAPYAAVTFTSAGGVAPVRMSLTGPLPAGMTFDTNAATLSGTPTQAGVYLVSVVARDANGCTGFINDTLDVDAKAGPPADREAMVPVVLRLTGSGTTYSSGLALTNTGNDAADVTLSFSGTSSGSAVQRVEARQQVAIGDVIGFLKDRGVPLSPEDVGTLRVSYTNTDPAPGVFVQARTTSPCGAGRCGVGYDAPATSSLGASRAAVYGLRQNASDRSNLALANAGRSGGVTLRIGLVSGDPGDPRQVFLGDVTLGAGEWRQIDGVLTLAGMTNGWATVERVSGSAPFIAYGVVNDQVTNDGAFVEMSSWPPRAEPLVVPVVVETGKYDTELTLTNPGPEADVTIAYVESLSAPGAAASPVMIRLRPDEQMVLPRVLDWLRAHGAGVGPAGEDHAGVLTVEFSAAGSGAAPVPAAGAASVRVSTAAPGGGHYGVSFAAVPHSTAAGTEAFVTGLREDGATRSNLALVNAGGPSGTPVGLTWEVYDGATGRKVGGGTVYLLSRTWYQRNRVLADFGVSSGYVRVVRVAGADPFIAYGVVNDGGSDTPGTNDGSFLKMEGVR